MRQVLNKDNYASSASCRRSSLGRGIVITVLLRLLCSFFFGAFLLLSGLLRLNPLEAVDIIVDFFSNQVGELLGWVSLDGLGH